LGTVSVATVTPLTLVMLGTITIGMTAALLAWRERSEPGATALVAMLAGQSWWSTFFVLELEATTFEARVLWSDVQWVGVVVIPVAWFLFAMAYTGRDRYLQRRYVALLSVVPAVTVLLAATGGSHDLLYVETTLVKRNGVAVLERVRGPWFWIITAYTYVLGLLGSIPLLGLVRSDSLPFRGQSVALLVGTLAPWASNVLFLAGAVPFAGVDPTPIAFAVSGVAYLGALTRFRLLGTNPSPNRRARRLVFERMQEAAIVVDSHDYVVDMNESAVETLGVTPGEALGRPARSVVPRYDELPADGPATDHLTIRTENGDRPYDATVTRISDFRGRAIGRVITFHDIGEHIRQQQRLEVLNRVLRHNIRTETNLIAGYADLMGEPHDRNAAIVKQHADNIAEMGEKARQISDIFERGRRQTDAVGLADLIGRSVDSVRRTHPEVTVVVGAVPDDVRVSAVLDAALENAVENAAEHNTNPDPHVRISVETVDDRVRVAVADDGPGISAYERSVLERGAESPLIHGSGLGLWMITWCAGIAGGEVTFAENRPTGSVVTLDVPFWRAEGGDSGPTDPVDARSTDSGGDDVDARPSP
jgi:PAS domain S-box-containing protein